MGLDSKTKLIVSPDGRQEIPADRHKVARVPLGYVVVDTHQPGTSACAAGLIVWSSDAAPASDDVAALRALSAQAAAQAAMLNHQEG